MPETTQTLDIRPLPHSDRLAAILERWRSLPVGESFRLKVEHNPVPLKFLFRGESPGEFDWQCEKEGPDEWVIRITRIAVPKAQAEDSRTSEEQDRQSMKNLLTQLHAGRDVSAVKEQAKDLLRKMDASTVAMLEQEMIHEGMGRDEMRRLCDAHLEIMRDSLGGGEISPAPGHPIHTLMEEHKVLKHHLEELKAYLEVMKNAADLAGISKELEGTRLVAHELLEAEKHHQREEEVIFPALAERGVTEPPEIMREEHTDLRAKKAALAEAGREPAKYQFKDWVQDIQEVGDYLVKELGNHIYKEDHILYQMALQTIEPEAWAEMKARCDKIGYCCFTPGFEAPAEKAKVS